MQVAMLRMCAVTPDGCLDLKYSHSASLTPTPDDLAALNCDLDRKPILDTIDKQAQVGGACWDAHIAAGRICHSLMRPARLVRDR